MHLVVDSSPMLDGDVLSPDLLDAMILAATGKAAEEMLEDDYLEIVTTLDMRPRLLYPNGYKRVNRFAFVIHPLSQEYFKIIKPVEVLSRVSPPLLMDSLEKVMAYAPPFVYSRVEGIRSPTGTEAEGWLISVGGTPREIMSHSPEFTYRRLPRAWFMPAWPKPSCWRWRGVSRVTPWAAPSSGSRCMRSTSWA